jgi:hypothetical protein
VVWVDVTELPDSGTYGITFTSGIKSFHPPSFSILQSVYLLYLSNVIVILKSLLVPLSHNGNVCPDDT